MSFQLFEDLKIDDLFIIKAEKLRRIRTEGGMPLIEYLATPRLQKIDNDLDRLPSEAVLA
jgi:hypothetical protein